MAVDVMLQIRESYREMRHGTKRRIDDMSDISSNISDLNKDIDAGKQDESVGTDSTGTDIASTDQASLSRRRLLKLGAYVPPAIIGMAIISSMPGVSHADDDKDKGGGGNASCMPSACSPCEHVGKKDKNKRKNKRKCRKARRKRRRS